MALSPHTIVLKHNVPCLTPIVVLSRQVRTVEGKPALVRYGTGRHEEAGAGSTPVLMARIRRERAYNVVSGVAKRPKMQSVPFRATNFRVKVLRGSAARPLHGIRRSPQTNSLASRSSMGGHHEGKKPEKRRSEDASEQKQALKVPYPRPARSQYQT